LLTAFRLLLSFTNPSLVTTLAGSIEQKRLLFWAWQHRYLVLLYYLVSLITGAYHSRSAQEEYTAVGADGILLNSGDTESIEVIKRRYP
jgi:hypothetical protein